jgi:hypothetical protein
MTSKNKILGVLMTKIANSSCDRRISNKEDKQEIYGYLPIFKAAKRLDSQIIT